MILYPSSTNQNIRQIDICAKNEKKLKILAWYQNTIINQNEIRFRI